MDNRNAIRVEIDIECLRVEREAMARIEANMAASFAGEDYPTARERRAVVRMAKAA